MSLFIGKCIMAPAVLASPTADQINGKMNAASAMSGITIPCLGCWLFKGKTANKASRKNVFL